jgi:NAD(P)-dependent dehydrogenase (short-subunit alcohol dehydrogenase family)
MISGGRGNDATEAVFLFLACLFFGEMRMEPVDFRLDGRVVVITGAAQGLGLAMAEALSSVGASIVIGDVQDVKAEEAADSIAKHYGNMTYALHMDVSDTSSINQAAQEILAKFGKIDILINNAGIAQRKRIEDVEERDWDRVMDINLKGVFLCSQAFGGSMIEQKRGKIINISSVVGFLGAEERISYGVSKSGVAHLTRLFASEWAKYGITVNAIAPGYLLTEMTESYFNQPDVKQKYLETVPLRRFGKPNDLSGLVVFLASDASNYITGQIFFVDGGRMLY